MNWTTIKRKDKELRERQQAASLELGRLRYENTIGVNPNGSPGFSKYAKECGVSDTAVRQSARAYEEWSNPKCTSDFGDCLWRQYAAQQDVEAIEAVAEARGISGTTARQHHREEVQQVKQAMEEKILKGSSPDEVRDYGRDLAKKKKTMRDSQRKQEQELLAKTGWTTRHMAVGMGKGYYGLMDALQVLRDGTIDEDVAEEGMRYVERCSSVLSLIEALLTHKVDVDWDAEMARLTEGE
jgi:hypothetical protein